MSGRSSLMWRVRTSSSTARRCWNTAQLPRHTYQYTVFPGHLPSLRSKDPASYVHIHNCIVVLIFLPLFGPVFGITGLSLFLKTVARPRSLYRSFWGFLLVPSCVAGEQQHFFIPMPYYSPIGERSRHRLRIVSISSLAPAQTVSLLVTLPELICSFHVPCKLPPPSSYFTAVCICTCSLHIACNAPYELRRRDSCGIFCSEDLVNCSPAT